MAKHEPELAGAVVEAGALPAPVTTGEIRQVGASLGDELIKKGALAAMVGQLPAAKGASIPPSHGTQVLPLRPAWPIWMQSLAVVSTRIKSASRRHAASCSGA